MSEIITNKEPKCTPVASVVKNDQGDALDGDLKNLASVNLKGLVEINEASYTGGDITLKFMISNPSGVKIYKDINLIEKCSVQTLSKVDKDKIYSFSAESLKPRSITM